MIYSDAWKCVHTNVTLLRRRPRLSGGAWRIPAQKALIRGPVVGRAIHCLRAVKHLSTFSRWLGDVYDVQVCKCNWQHIISVCSLWPGSKGELLAHSAAVKHLLLDSFNGRPSRSHRSRYESTTCSHCCSFRRAKPLPIHNSSAPTYQSPSIQTCVLYGVSRIAVLILGYILSNVFCSVDQLHEDK